MIKLTNDEQERIDTCCSLCLEDAVLTTGDYRWCEVHQDRGELLRWGMLRGYPELDGGSVAIGKGAYCWTIAATQGNDDMILVLLGTIEISEVA